MNSKDTAILVNSALSLVELIVRLRSEQPDDFKGEEERLNRLSKLTKQLQDKPDDYLQNWEPGE